MNFPTWMPWIALSGAVILVIGYAAAKIVSARRKQRRPTSDDIYPLF